MKRDLIEFLCDPVDQSELKLVEEVVRSDGEIESGMLISVETGRKYAIKSGIPRFNEDAVAGDSVESFGNEWNYFNYDLFRINWMNHVISNTFGDGTVFKEQIVVDCGAGSGMQSRWMAELGAKRVIVLELSNAVDGVIKKNLTGLSNVDVIQCSIDQPPLKRGSIEGIVICHNVIQHTPSVEKTAKALWGLVGKNGEFVFNCYLKYSDNRFWMLRWYAVYLPLRMVLSRTSFGTVLFYAEVMAILRFVPVLGWLLEKAQFVIRGDVPKGPHYLRRQWKNTVLNTYDWYGFHKYQHQKTEQEIRNLVAELQPDSTQVRNLEEYFTRPLRPGLAIRVGNFAP